MGSTTAHTNEIENWLLSQVAEVLQTDTREIDRHAPYNCLGLDSITLFRLMGELAEWLNRDISATATWEYPTIAKLASHLAQEPRGEESIPTRPRDKPLPLSYSQERIWRYARRDEKGDDNFVLLRWKLFGRLDVEAFRRTVDEVAGRHEILRTTFDVIDEQPVQIIHPPAPATIHFVDLSAEPDPLARAAQLLAEEDGRTMALNQGPLFRVHLFRISETEYRAIFNLHHLLYDASSIDVFYTEFSAIYGAFLHGRASPYVKPPFQAADFGVWQRERLRPEGECYQGLLAWWKDYWAGELPAPLRLPFEWEPHAAVPQLEKSVMWLRLPDDLSEKLKTLARKGGGSHFMALLATFEVLLHRYTGREEMIIGTYVSDRSRSAVNEAMGFFVSLVSLRIDLKGDPTFLELVARVQEMLQKVSQRQEFPFEEFCRELQREDRQIPWVQLIFQHVLDPRLSFRLEGLLAERWLDDPRARMPWGLAVQIYEAPDGIFMRLSFDSGKYDPERAALILPQLKTLVEIVVANPELRLSDLAVIPLPVVDSLG